MKSQDSKPTKNKKQKKKRRLRLLDWHHVILGKKTPSSSCKFFIIWFYLKGFALWTMWLERNDLTFNNARWEETEIHQTIWQGFVRIAWNQPPIDSKRDATHDNILVKV